MKRYSKFVILAGLLLIAGVFAQAVWEKEQVLEAGQQVFIKLAPVDPRSLMQGDYMILRYSIPEDIRDKVRELSKGKLVYTLDENKVVTLQRVVDPANDSEQVLTEQEKLLVFRYRSRFVRLGANSFFFQEGKSEVFASAKYGELRVAEDGEAVLVGLRDEEYRLLGLSSGL